MNVDNIDMLKSLYKGASMGLLSVKAILTDVSNFKLLQHLENHINLYKKVRFDAGSQLLDANIHPEELCGREKAMAVMKIRMSLSKDKSTSNIATMLILGSTMGIINWIKALNEYDQAEDKITSQTQKAIDIENQNITALYKFL